MGGLPERGRSSRPGQPLGVEALEPVAHGLRVEAQVLGDGGDGAALMRLPDDLRPLDLPGGGGAGVRQALNRGAFVVGQGSDTDSHARSIPHLPDAPLSTF